MEPTQQKEERPAKGELYCTHCQRSFPADSGHNHYGDGFNNDLIAGIQKDSGSGD